MNKVTKVIVKYNGLVVGYLVESGDKIAFKYDNEWLKNGFSISPLSLKLSSDVFVSTKQHFGGLFGVFHDSLPDGWGELLVRRMLIKKGINPDKVSTLTKLTLISGNGLGALTYEPCQVSHVDQVCDLDTLANECKKILEDENDFVDLDKLFDVGGSSGGARPKAHLKIDNDFWIVKFPSSIDPVNIGELEFQANSLAKKCGINVNEFTMFKSNNGNAYFGAKRFDRQKDKNVHMISLSSLLETSHKIPNLDYIHLFQVIDKICVQKEDLYEAFKRMCFNVFYGNKDDHGKNFAFLYDEDLRGYKLSPAYDLTKTPRKLEHEMSVNGNGMPSESDLLAVASSFDLSLERCKQIMESIKSLLNCDIK
ncbi:MAG: type II toxin-antitoxin system HipA family toxin [Clostridia bacterium]|nr:type II toxin-antitoxin system HipA family toxin [Clostridia bacterium]